MLISMGTSGGPVKESSEKVACPELTWTDTVGCNIGENTALEEIKEIVKPAALEPLIVL